MHREVRPVQCRAVRAGEMLSHAAQFEQGRGSVGTTARIDRGVRDRAHETFTRSPASSSPVTAA